MDLSRNDIVRLINWGIIVRNEFGLYDSDLELYTYLKSVLEIKR